MIKHGKSPLNNKRFRVWMKNGEHFDYGYKSPEGKTAKTFIDGATPQKRSAYIARHLGNRTERYRIEKLIPSPALFSFYLLWGSSQDFYENFDHLNEMFKKKYNI